MKADLDGITTKLIIVLLIALGINVSIFSGSKTNADTTNRDKLPSKVIVEFIKKVRSCWIIPAGAREANIQVKLRVRLNRDGSVDGIPDMLNYQNSKLYEFTANSAVAALLKCQNYNVLPADDYEIWKELVLNFDPNMFFDTPREPLLRSQDQKLIAAKEKNKAESQQGLPPCKGTASSKDCFVEAPSLSACTKASDNDTKVRMCTVVIENRPKKANLIAALDVRGRALQGLNQHQEAIKDFTALIELSPKVAAYYDGRQASYKSLGNLSAALADANTAVSLSPNKAFVLHSRASILFALGRLEEAIVDFKKAIGLDPKPAFRYYDLGRTYIAAGDYASAISSLNVVVEKAPTWSLGYKQRAIAKYKSRQLEEAVKDVEKATLTGHFDQELDNLRKSIAAELNRFPNVIAKYESPQQKVAVTNDNTRRLALVVGIDSYQNVPQLQKAVNDSKAVSKALQKIGYDVVSVENPDRRTMSQKLQEFQSKIQPGDTAFFFFAGHGVALGPDNILLAADVPKLEPGQDEVANDEGFSVDNIIRRFQKQGAKTAMLILDACRNNPFEASGTRSVGNTRGLNKQDAPEGVFVLFSAGLGQEALDRLSDEDPDPNSVFTRKLIPALLTPSITHNDLAKRVQKDVSELAATVNVKQQPAYYDQIVGEIPMNGLK